VGGSGVGVGGASVGASVGCTGASVGALVGSGCGVGVSLPPQATSASATISSKLSAIHKRLFIFFTSLI